MTTSAEGGGTANDATVATFDNFGLDADQMRELLARHGVVAQPTDLELAEIAVRNGEDKVRKQKAHLEGAKQALTDAKAALAAAKKEG